MRKGIECASAALGLLLGLGAPVLAEVTVYDKGGLKLTAGFDAGFGGFSVSNIDFGVGNLDTNFRSRERSRSWFEGFAKPSGAFEYQAGPSALYGGASWVYATTRGGGDAVSGLAPSGSRSTTSDGPSRGEMEDYFVGWRSGSLFGKLGDDAIDLSVGRQGFVIGDGLVVGDGAAEGWGRGAFYLGPRVSFDHIAILRYTPSEIAPVKGSVFHLASRTSQHTMSNNDQAATSLVGLNVEWYEGAELVAGFYLPQAL